MKIEGVPYQCVDWNKIKEERHAGESGEAVWRTFEKGNVRARVVEYSAGYLANHWCPRGHVLFVLEGSVISELEDGSKEELSAGMGYVAQDDEKNRHRSFSPNGVKLFIVD
ncbi:MAG: DHCW motif cupin fold protein [Synergistes sp.]|nr:DHCW motif cupin fold protein [Synergistes sp.]MCR5335348.1 DHCW motif cupin fold protein [Synergistes sp.]